MAAGSTRQKAKYREQRANRSTNKLRGGKRHRFPPLCFYRQGEQEPGATRIAIVVGDIAPQEAPTAAQRQPQPHPIGIVVEFHEIIEDALTVVKSSIPIPVSATLITNC